MILKEECKKLNISVGDLSVECGVPVRTLQDWAKSHPKRIRTCLDAIRHRQSQEGDSHLQDELI